MIDEQMPEMTPDNFTYRSDTELPEYLRSEVLPHEFRRSRLAIFTLFFLLIFWPVSSLVFVDDPVETLKLFATSPIWLVYLPTMIIQWLIFGLIYLTIWREKTGLKGIGLGKIKPIDFLYAGGFLLVSNLILTFLALTLEVFNIEVPGELALILPDSTNERIIWVFLSFTAGFCEEVAFRGYLMTRIRMYGKLKTWVIPTILASLAFGSGHSYQGLGGFIIITVYGAMFAGLYLYSKSLWPPVIAHFFQDFSALFFPFEA